MAFASPPSSSSLSRAAEADDSPATARCSTPPPKQTLTQHRRHRRNFWEKLEGHFGFGPSATSSAEASKGTGVVDKGKAQSDDGRHYWYVEDSDDQKHWREKDEEKKEKDDKTKDKRDVGDLFEDIANEVNAEGATSDLGASPLPMAQRVSTCECLPAAS